MNKDLAVVGVGYWGKNLFRVFNELGVLHSFCDTNQQNISNIQKNYPNVSFEEDFNQLLKNEKVKKVVIATPTLTHYELVKKALLAGKDVFVEKAMCESIEQAEEIVHLAKSYNKVCMVGHLLHYHPALQEMKKRVAQGEVGELLSLTFNRLNFGSRGIETSALMAFAPHDLSLLLSFCSQKNLLDLQCFSSSHYCSSLQDESTLMLQFKKNVQAKIFVSWLYPYPERKFVIIGTKGTLVFDDLKNWDGKLTFWPTSITRCEQFLNFKQDVGAQHISLQQKEPLREEALHFIACCENRKSPITDAEEGLGVLKLLEKAKNQSSQFSNYMKDLASNEAITV